MSAPLNKHDGTENIITIPGIGVMLAHGSSVPADGGAGYGPGCLYIQRTTPKLYINTGSVTSSTWTVVGSQS